MRDRDLRWGVGIVIVVVALAIVAGLPAQAIAIWGIAAAVVAALCWLAFGRDRPHRLADQTSLPAADVLDIARDWFADVGWTLQHSDASDLTFERRLPVNYAAVLVLALVGLLPGLVVLLGTMKRRQTIAVQTSRAGGHTLIDVVVRPDANGGRWIATQLLERIDALALAGPAAPA